MSNHLVNERSAYLRQHADNPVDWYPWGEEAFSRAKAEDKPILLSIGYASCHWCHVMAQESFEDRQVAALINRSFIAVKVDREERPDVDAVYMAACTALNGSGGWPLTAFLTPTGEPFFVATYLPKNNRGRSMGFVQLLQVIAAKWQRDRASLLRAGSEITAALQHSAAPAASEPDEELLKVGIGQLMDGFDAEYGGFGRERKFPCGQNLLLLMRYARLSGDKAARRAVELTLRQMYRGGICDHIGGGFARYSTDREWLVPHFEKTLYDNALLALCYTEAWQDGRLPLWRQVAESTLDYCLRELRSERGGYYSSQDADSEGGEGAYYLFTPAEVAEALGAEAGGHFAECYDITAEGNFHGKSIPNLLLNQRWQLLPEGYGDLCEKLRLYRAARQSLAVDRKLPTGWNGLMLLALSKAAWVFEDKRYAAYARELGDFLLQDAGAAEPGTLRALCYDEGPAALPGQLEDYVFCALGFLELYRVDYESAWLLRAEALAGVLGERFSDRQGGFFQTAEDAERLIVRPKTIFDGALPCGNTAAAVLFDRLARLSGEANWRDAAWAQLRYLAGAAGSYPGGIPCGLLALLGEVYGTRELVCVSEDVPAGLRAVTATYAPELNVLLKRPGDRLLERFAPFTAPMAQIEGKSTYYVCRGGVCGLPFTQD